MKITIKKGGVSFCYEEDSENGETAQMARGNKFEETFLLRNISTLCNKVNEMYEAEYQCDKEQKKETANDNT